MRTRLDIMIHVDMDCDELLLGGVKAVTAMLSGTCVTWAQSRSNVSVALVRCMALSPLSREINVDRSLKSLKRAHVKNLTEPNGTAPQMDPRTRTVLFSSVCRDRVYRSSVVTPSVSDRRPVPAERGPESGRRPPPWLPACPPGVGHCDQAAIGVPERCARPHE